LKHNYFKNNPKPTKLLELPFHKYKNKEENEKENIENIENIENEKKRKINEINPDSNEKSNIKRKLF
jgi:hypothetical protein